MKRSKIRTLSMKAKLNDWSSFILLIYSEVPEEGTPFCSFHFFGLGL